MPSTLPSSFASAAAGQNSSRDGRIANRNDGWASNNGDKSARAGRSTNGTLTFRRASTTASNQSPSQMNSSDAASTDPTITTAMPVGSTAVENPTPLRYSREQLLSVLEAGREGPPQPDISTLFMPGWNPRHTNGSSARGWGKTTESHLAPQEPDLCWNGPGDTKALGLQDMSPEEKELFASDVKSTLKPLAQNKDGNHPTGGPNGRKMSLSHNSNNFGLPSPSTASRPGTRRRETTDTNPYSGGGGLTSPTSTNRHPRDDQPSWFSKRGDPKESSPEEAEEEAETREPVSKPLPFGGLMRTNTTPGGSTFGAQSPWQQPSSSTAISGGGAFGNFAMPGSAMGEKRPGVPRGESRLAHLMPKDSSDNIVGKSGEASGTDDPSRSWRSRPRTDTDPFGNASLSGSAVLGGAQDISPPPTNHPSLYDTPVKGSASEFGMSGLALETHTEYEQTPFSPSETNPYRSPAGDRGEHDEVGRKSHELGGVADHSSNYGGGPPRSFAAHAAFDGSDRSQTSSVGAKPYPHLSNLTGWPSSSTPDRERAPFGGFGSSLFGQPGDLHSPGLGNLGGVFGPSTTAGFGGTGSLSRGSKLGPLFPPAMQAQMQSQDNESLSGSIPDLRQTHPLGAIGRNPLNDSMREADSPLRAGRNHFADMFASTESNRAPASSEPLHIGIPTSSQGHIFSSTANAPVFPSNNQSSEPPTAQSKVMVMPDRMRWVYLDPQGQQQGPFTGLEMNDWYKASFFTPDLRVKKLEESDFEPLGQLIRRIGNSREPFLVPQIGIPHGLPSQSGPFSPNSSGVIQPPLVGAFPSFGRTLTAEEQNNLERRKQEEQYNMARQREYLSNQQSVGRFVPGMPNLNHQSSAHSLQSQPSFGSMTSPMVMQPPQQPPIGTIGTGSSFFDATAGPGSNGPGLDSFRDEELARLTALERQTLTGLQSAGVRGANVAPPPIGHVSPDSTIRNRLPRTGDLAEDAEGFRGRLQEFEQLRAQRDAGQIELPYPAARQTYLEEQASAARSPVEQQHEEGPAITGTRELDYSNRPPRKIDTAAAGKSFREYQQAQAAAAASKLSGLPLPFPPPQSSTPLPAPAPLRVKSNLPEQYATSSRTGSPEISTPYSGTQPPLAPWAKETGADSHKGPSLKEIQQAEAIKAAKDEEAAAAARRALLEQEAAREKERVAAAAPGLPPSSLWGTSSPISAGPSSSPWVKPAAIKGPGSNLSSTTQSADKKKTLADIQREEEARKQKDKQTSGQSGASSGAGKRYADLASKPNAAPAAGPGSGVNTPAVSGWATVGAGGKVKGPISPAVQTRSASTASVKPASSVVAPTPRPSIKTTNSTIGGGGTEALGEFNKWLHSQLSKGITGVTDIDTFAQALLAFPPQADLIADAVYATSKTMDGRHFANEFIRRKKLADKGVVEKHSSNSPSTDTQSTSAGGWNEVAKKGGHKESPSDATSIQGAGFKVVPGRKKGKK